MLTDCLKSDWLVQVPLSQLVELQNMMNNQDKLAKENAQLRREVEGLRGIQFQCMEIITELRKAQCKQ